VSLNILRDCLAFFSTGEKYRGSVPKWTVTVDLKQTGYKKSYFLRMTADNCRDNTPK
jgi:hypothetical protein